MVANVPFRSGVNTAFAFGPQLQSRAQMPHGHAGSGGQNPFFSNVGPGSIFGNSNTSGNASVLRPTGQMLGSETCALVSDGGKPKTCPSEGQKFLDTLKMLAEAKKALVWPFSGIGTAHCTQFLFQGLSLSFEEHRWEYERRPVAEREAFLDECNQAVFTLQREFYFLAKSKALAEGLSFPIDSTFENPPLKAPPCFRQTPVERTLPGVEPAVSSVASNFRESPVMQDRGAIRPGGRSPSEENALEPPQRSVYEALQAFKSARFQFGEVPESPPSPELCV